MLWKSLDFGGESRQSPGRPIPWHPSHQATADSLHAYRGIRGTDRWHQTLQESASIPWVTTLQSNSCSPVLSTGYTPPWTRAFPPVNDSLQVISAFRTWRLFFSPRAQIVFSYYRILCFCKLSCYKFVATWTCIFRVYSIITYWLTCFIPEIKQNFFCM